MQDNQEGCDMLKHLLHYKMNKVMLHDPPPPNMSKVNSALSASPNNPVSPTDFDTFFSCF